MNINVTLIAQAIAFAAFIWFTVRFVWPPLTARHRSAPEDRSPTASRPPSAARLDSKLAAKQAERDDGRSAQRAAGDRRAGRKPRCADGRGSEGCRQGRG